jgi:hypothetical protein
MILDRAGGTTHDGHAVNRFKREHTGPLGPRVLTVATGRSLLRREIPGRENYSENSSIEGDGRIVLFRETIGLFDNDYVIAKAIAKGVHHRRRQVASLEIEPFELLEVGGVEEGTRSLLADIVNPEGEESYVRESR